MAAVAVDCLHDAVLDAVAPIVLASAHDTALVVDLGEGLIVYPGEHTLAALVNDGPRLVDLTPDRKGVAVLPNGGVGIDAGGNRIFATIWDGGGTDTYDLSAYSTDLTLNLQPGESSYFSAVQIANLGNGHFARGNIFNALLFETKRFTRWPRDTSPLFQGVKLREAVRAIETAHQPIEHMFGKGVGYRLLFIESTILMGVLEVLFAEGITALPLHDSVLVDRPQAARAKEVMEGVFELTTGESGGMVSIELSV